MSNLKMSFQERFCEELNNITTRLKYKDVAMQTGGATNQQDVSTICGMKTRCETREDQNEVTVNPTVVTPLQTVIDQIEDDK